MKRITKRTTFDACAERPHYLSVAISRGRAAATPTIPPESSAGLRRRQGKHRFRSAAKGRQQILKRHANSVLSPEHDQSIRLKLKTVQYPSLLRRWNNSVQMKRRRRQQ